MLILDRGVGQSLIFGDNIEVRVESVGTNTVRLSITAPHEIPIHRKELIERGYDQVRQPPEHLLESDPQPNTPMISD